MSTPTPTTEERDLLLLAVQRRRAQARAVLFFEALWPALWPALGIAGAFLVVALLDILPMLGPWGHAAVLAGSGLAVLALLWRGLRGLRLPGVAAADRRLEAASGLRHQPLAVLADRPAPGGEEAVWRAHVDRAAARIGRLRVGLPRPGLAARDPRALRGLVAVSLFAALVIAGPMAPARLLRAFQPAFTPLAVAPPTLIQAWITPPGFTGLAPVFLRPEGGQVSVPAGSHLTVSLTGGGGHVPVLALGPAAAPFRTLAAASFQAERDLSTGGRIEVRRGGRALAAWELTVVADRAPQVRFPEPPGATRDARLPQARLPWEVSHEYGVVGLQAELRLADRPELAPLIVPIPLPGGAPKTARGVRTEDLTASPWAGLPVIAHLAARDAAGLVGTSAAARFTLPERHFHNLIAQALMAVRRMLTLKPDGRAPAIHELDRLAGIDQVWRDDLPAFLNLRAIASLLYRDHAAAAVEEAQSRMWQLALHLEEGAPSRTAKALEAARAALRAALDARKRGEPVDPKEVDRRVQALREALRKRLDALAEQARRDPGGVPFDPTRDPLDARDMQDKARQMHESARQGNMESTRQQLAQLEQMLKALQDGRPDRGPMTAEQQKRAAQRRQGQQQMSVLQDIVRRQGDLLDHAQNRAQASIPSPDDDRQRAGDGQVQAALRRVLGELMQQYGDLTGRVPPNLGDAVNAMRDAGQSLAGADDPSAAAAEQRAIAALQKGGQAMGQQMAQQFGQPGQGEGQDGQGDGQQMGQGDQQGQGQFGRGRFGQGQGQQYGYGGSRGFGRGWGRSMDRRGGQRDPLGRRLGDGVGGRELDGSVTLPDQMEAARSRAIQQELRKRESDRTRPQLELDYIQRLLREF
ncbi:MAG: DUF4175 family protein [Rhodospirillales bacterium]|nr:DUF4175 family protein [Rhodospirillales bacterium]MDE2574472.1 DUF4175 family protein [Rhodospirillales bacterium]